MSYVIFCSLLCEGVMHALKLPLTMKQELEMKTLRHIAVFTHVQVRLLPW